MLLSRLSAACASAASLAAAPRDPPGWPIPIFCRPNAVIPLIAADLRASFRSPPFIKVAIPEPSAAPGAPKKAPKTMGRTTVTTFLTAPFNFFQSLLKKPNSIKPVSGLTLFTEEPTTYCSGSSIPASRSSEKI